MGGLFVIRASSRTNLRVCYRIDYKGRLAAVDEQALTFIPSGPLIANPGASGIRAP